MKMRGKYYRDLDDRGSTVPRHGARWFRQGNEEQTRRSSSRSADCAMVPMPSTFMSQSRKPRGAPTRVFDPVLGRSRARLLRSKLPRFLADRHGAGTSLGTYDLFRRWRAFVRAPAGFHDRVTDTGFRVQPARRNPNKLLCWRLFAQGSGLAQIARKRRSRMAKGLVRPFRPRNPSSYREGGPHLS